jgi:hypothetical protein
MGAKFSRNKPKIIDATAFYDRLDMMGKRRNTSITFL